VSLLEDNQALLEVNQANSGGNPVKKEGVKEGDGKVIITLLESEQS